jgi:hypothetical protein
MPQTLSGTAEFGLVSKTPARYDVISLAIQGGPQRGGSYIPTFGLPTIRSEQSLKHCALRTFLTGIRAIAEQ